MVLCKEWYSNVDWKLLKGMDRGWWYEWRSIVGIRGKIWLDLCELSQAIIYEATGATFYTVGTLYMYFIGIGIIISSVEICCMFIPRST